MFKSLEVLKSLPGDEERRETCESFKASLLGALRPKVIRDISEGNNALLQEYLYVFKKLDR